MCPGCIIPRQLVGRSDHDQNNLQSFPIDDVYHRGRVVECQSRSASTTVLTGDWVGNSEPSGRSEFLRLSLTENAGEMQRPLKAKATLVQLEGSRVRLEFSSLKLVMTGTLTGDEIEGEAEIPGTKARFHLTRIVKVAPETLARYVGAYRFRNGDYIVLDRFPNTQDTCG